MIDAHCHLDTKEFHSDRDAVVGRAMENGVTKAIVSSINATSFQKVLELKKKYPDFVLMTAGLAPADASEKEFKAVEGLIRKNKKEIIAIGEVGLDYYWVKEKGKHDEQKKVFIEFIDLAAELHLPLVVHCREAYEDLLFLLKEKKPEKTMIHCYSGTPEMALEFAELGCIISISTLIARSSKHKRYVEALPLDRIVVETDAPYLGPVAKERNEPANIRKAAEEIAKIKNISFEEAAEKITENTVRFFNL